MKYFAEPFLHIIDYEKMKEIFCFDSSGTFETNDKEIIEFMKKHKPFIKNKKGGGKNGNNSTASI